MIRKREIEQKAEMQQVPKSTIDKDWVLGHFNSLVNSDKNGYSGQLDSYDDQISIGWGYNFDKRRNYN